MNNLVKYFPRNEIGRDFVVGDIHGCFDALRQTLANVEFDFSKDRLFSVGDLVDRGTQSEEAIDWIAKPWFHAVRGNHEQMAIDCFHHNWPQDNYVVNGGGWFTKLTPERQKLIVQIFETLPVMIELDHQLGKVGIVHAEVPDSNWETALDMINDNNDYDINKLLWSRSRFMKRDTSMIEGVDRVYVGHTPLNEYIILGNIYYIDTGEVFGNKLTLLEIK